MTKTNPKLQVLRQGWSRDSGDSLRRQVLNRSIGKDCKKPSVGKQKLESLLQSFYAGKNSVSDRAQSIKSFQQWLKDAQKPTSRQMIEKIKTLENLESIKARVLLASRNIILTI